MLACYVHRVCGDRRTPNAGQRSNCGASGHDAVHAARKAPTQSQFRSAHADGQRMDVLMGTFRPLLSSSSARTDANAAGSSQVAQLAEASERSLHPVALLAPDGTLLRANP